MWRINLGIAVLALVVGVSKAISESGDIGNRIIQGVVWLIVGAFVLGMVAGTIGVIEQLRDAQRAGRFWAQLWAGVRWILIASVVAVGIVWVMSLRLASVTR